MPYVPHVDAIALPGVDLVELARGQGPGPWRLSLVGDDGVRAVLLGWPPGFITVPHQHPRASEMFVVQAGRLGFRLASAAEEEAGPGSFLVARPGEFHGLRVIGNEPLVLLAIVGPNEDLADEAVEDHHVWPDWAAG
jgi:quercetin dioxygenase-like cupin family protein